MTLPKALKFDAPSGPGEEYYLLLHYLPKRQVITNPDIIPTATLQT